MTAADAETPDLAELRRRWAHADRERRRRDRIRGGPPVGRWPADALQGCGTHAAARRHIANNETVPGPRGGQQPACAECRRALAEAKAEAYQRRKQAKQRNRATIRRQAT